MLTKPLFYPFIGRFLYIFERKAGNNNSESDSQHENDWSIDINAQQK